MERIQTNDGAERKVAYEKARQIGDNLCRALAVATVALGGVNAMKSADGTIGDLPDVLRGDGRIWQLGQQAAQRMAEAQGIDGKKEYRMVLPAPTSADSGSLPRKIITEFGDYRTEIRFENEGDVTHAN